MNIVLEAAQPPVLTAPYPGGMCKITFRHPWYDDTNNTMLLLFAPDAVKDPVTDETSWGLYAQYALDACGIIACNRFDGWLSEFKDVDHAATPAGRIDASSILLGRRYYFHIPKLNSDAADTPYPIVQTFQQWSFPHGNLPDSWTRAMIPDPHDAAPLDEAYAPSRLRIALHVRDRTCRITGCKPGVQPAHLCPPTEGSWWFKNSMAVYGTINNSSNALLLRSDLYQCFDERKFVFVPKPSSGPEGTSTHFVIHLMQLSKELHILYHNRKLQSISETTSLPWIFVRFAWALFNENGAILKSPHFGKNLEGAQSEETPTEMTHWTRSTKRRKLDSDAASGGETSTAAPDDATSEEQGSQCSLSEGQSPPPVPDARLTSPPASPPSSRGRQHSNDGQAFAEDAEPAFSLESKVKKWLERERRRSDPEHHWEKEKVWAEMVTGGEMVLDEASARRLCEISGGEVFDADEVGSPFREEARELEEAGMGP